MGTPQGSARGRAPGVGAAAETIEMKPTSSMVADRITATLPAVGTERQSCGDDRPGPWYGPGRLVRGLGPTIWWKRSWRERPWTTRRGTVIARLVAAPVPRPRHHGPACSPRLGQYPEARRRIPRSGASFSCWATGSARSFHRPREQAPRRGPGRPPPRGFPGRSPAPRPLVPPPSRCRRRWQRGPRSPDSRA